MGEWESGCVCVFLFVRSFFKGHGKRLHLTNTPTHTHGVCFVCRSHTHTADLTWPTFIQLSPLPTSHHKSLSAHFSALGHTYKPFFLVLRKRVRNVLFSLPLAISTIAYSTKKDKKKYEHRDEKKEIWIQIETFFWGQDIFQIFLSLSMYIISGFNQPPTITTTIENWQKPARLARYPHTHTHTHKYKLSLSCTP